ncbi:MAG: hypothetical protein RL538_688 [Candidatus Parcubacteria bacterium]|jgi:hypothetical protein
MCILQTLRVGDGYVVDEFYSATIIIKEGRYFLAYNGVELEIRSVAASSDGKKAALKIGARKTKKGVAVTPSPLVS